ncbi:hypothetical protein ABZ845_21745 [Streptomyces sp. NPDC047022]|uniref:hypothetical protein n=1 Tax=Streptomyces sp. NPDC047022 TaxID=3155737 RepID=UPI0033C56621
MEPENDLRAWHLVGLADAEPLHWPIGIQGGSFSVSRDIADLLKSPTVGEPYVCHPRMIPLASVRAVAGKGLLAGTAFFLPWVSPEILVSWVFAGQGQQA